MLKKQQLAGSNELWTSLKSNRQVPSKRQCQTDFSQKSPISPWQAVSTNGLALAESSSRLSRKVQGYLKTQMRTLVLTNFAGHEGQHQPAVIAAHGLASLLST